MRRFIRAFALVRASLASPASRAPPRVHPRGNAAPGRHRSPEMVDGLVARLAFSYGVAWLLPAHTAAAATHFLRRFLIPLYRRAGWRLRRVLTDGGPEFKGGVR